MIKKLIEIYYRIKKKFEIKKTENEKIIDYIYDDLHKMLALEEYAKKYCTEDNAKELYNRNMQTVKNEMISLLNGIDFFDLDYNREKKD